MSPTTLLTIEPHHDAWWLCQHGTYPESSILAGQEFRQLCKPYPTKEQAISDNPGVLVLEADWTPQVSVPVNPPEWFDEANAGEHWNEDY